MPVADPLWEHQGAHDKLATPERKLWASVIVRALRDYWIPPMFLKGIRKDANANDRSSARKWINSPSDKPRSFIWACGVVGVDSIALRKLVVEGDILTIEAWCNSHPSTRRTDLNGNHNPH